MGYLLKIYTVPLKISQQVRKFARKIESFAPKYPKMLLVIFELLIFRDALDALGVRALGSARIAFFGLSQVDLYQQHKSQGEKNSMSSESS